MKYYKYIFIVLVYKNIDVLVDFFSNFKIPNSHIIVVNSFYNQETEHKCHRVAECNKASYINIPNKGYSYGNNIGVEYAINNYSFDFIIISNSDIIIDNWIDLATYKNSNIVIAPKIIATSLHNKNQNPNIVKYSKNLYYNLLKQGYHKQKNWKLFLAHAYSRITRELFHLNNKVLGQRNIDIFSAHGSFIILTYTAVKNLLPIFNDDMFLYNEELYLAFRCKEKGIKILYNDDIKILHLEGASSSHVMADEEKKSFLVLDNYITKR